jgi:hypothetical protein
MGTGRGRQHLQVLGKLNLTIGGPIQGAPSRYGSGFYLFLPAA